MSGHYRDYKELLVYSGSVIDEVFAIGQSTYNSIQIMTVTTGAYGTSGHNGKIRLEASNMARDKKEASQLSSASYAVLEGPWSGSGYFLTGSNSGGSVVIDVGNVNAKFLRAYVGPMDKTGIFRIGLHGKGE